jgi:hypothetical protein
MGSKEASGGSGAVVDFYNELGLDRTWSVAQLRAKLSKLELQWGRRASLAGKHGDEARERLTVIEAALEMFTDEDAKERYDHRLRSAGSSDSDETVNWVARAWTYYFVEDYDAAGVAARKARERGSDDPAAYVVSARIALAQGEAGRAAEYASEAYVLDEDKENAFEVHEVRGTTFNALSKYDRAVEAFKKAITLATPTQTPEICLRLARAQYGNKEYDDALSSCLLGMQEDKGGVLEDLLVKAACRSISGMLGFKRDDYYDKSAEEVVRSMRERIEIYDENMVVVRSIRERIERYDLRQSGKQRVLAQVDGFMAIFSLVEKTREKPPSHYDGTEPSAPVIATWFFIILLPMRFLIVNKGVLASKLTFTLVVLFAYLVIRWWVSNVKDDKYRDGKKRFKEEQREYEINENTLHKLTELAVEDDELSKYMLLSTK